MSGGSVLVLLFFIGLASDEEVEEEVSGKVARVEKKKQCCRIVVVLYWWKIRSIYSDILLRPFFNGFSLTFTTMLLAGNQIKLPLLKILRTRG